MNRRQLLKQLLLVSSATSAPTFLVRSLKAAQQSGMSKLDLANPNRILVVIELAGGCDGLNTVIPFNNDHYRRGRPALRIDAGQVLKIDDRVGFHPAMTGLKELYDQGALAVIEGVGYPNPNRSHFRSRDIWYTAEPDQIAQEGWLAKYLQDQPKTGSLQGVNIGGRVPGALSSSSASSPSIQSIDTYKLEGDRAYPGDDQNKNAVLQEVLTEPQLNSYRYQEYVTQTVLEATLSSVQLLEGRNNYKSTIEYPVTAFSQNMRTIAQIISADLGVKVFYATIGGFDTHANQIQGGNSLLGVHTNLLQTFSDALSAFYRDLKQMGKSEDVLIMTFSEFGRRVAENGSNGTDHGTANQMFVLGGGIFPGFFGSHPSLAPDALDRVGDMQFSVDFRSVYATVLSNWLGADSGIVLGENWSMMPFL